MIRDVKTGFDFAKGNAKQMEPCGLKPLEDLPTITFVEGLWFAALPYIKQNKLTGRIEVSIEGRVPYIGLSLEEAGHDETLYKELKNTYSGIERRL